MKFCNSVLYYHVAIMTQPHSVGCPSCLRAGLEGDDGADGLAGHDLAQVAVHVHVEHVDGQLVVAGHHRGCHVHDLEAPVVDFVIADVVELGCCGILLGVGGVDAVHAGALEHDVGLDLDGA